jgi:hypothetical protein
MYCYNCGNKNEGNERFCANCGAPQTNMQPTNNVNNIVDELPKNSNFLLTLVVLFLIVVAGVLFLITYKENYDYKQYINYKQFKVYYPLGFKAEIGQEEDKESDDKHLYLTSDSVKYTFNYEDDNNYESYKKNNYKDVESFLKSIGYEVKKTEEKKIKDHNIIVSLLKTSEDKEMYFYIYDTKITRTIYYGYVASDDDLDDKVLEELVTILTKVEYKESK